VSQYIANLNQLSPPQGPLDESVASEEDFSAFLSNDFFDIDNNPIPNFDAPLDLGVDVAAASLTQPSLGNNSRKHSIQTGADPSMEFNLNGKCISSLFPFLKLRTVTPGSGATVVYCSQHVVQ
jgi:hypothetical protein